MGIRELFGSLVQAIGNVFGWALHRSTLKNAEDMKQRKQAQDEADRMAKVNEAIAKGDVETLRKELGE